MHSGITKGIGLIGLIRGSSYCPPYRSTLPFLRGVGIPWLDLHIRHVTICCFSLTMAIKNKFFGVIIDDINCVTEGQKLEINFT